MEVLNKSHSIMMRCGKRTNKRRDDSRIRQLEKTIENLQRKVDDLEQIVANLQASKINYVHLPINGDWLSPPPGYIGDWIPTRK